MSPKGRLALSNAACYVRLLRRRRLRVSLIVFLIAFAYLAIILPSSLRRARQAELAAYDASIAHLASPRVFIAAMLANCAPLLSNYWIPSLLELIDKLGRDNVHVSILENGSLDETRTLLKDLERNLTQRRVPYTLRFEDQFRDGVEFQKDGVLRRLLGKEGTGDNWIMTDKGWYPRRISYLAQLRNMVLDPLNYSSRKFDRVLFINDVIFAVRPLLISLTAGRRCHPVVAYEQWTLRSCLWPRLLSTAPILRHLCHARCRWKSDDIDFLPLLPPRQNPPAVSLRRSPHPSKILLERNG